MISIHFALLNWFFISCLNSTLNVRHPFTVKLVLQIQISISTSFDAMFSILCNEMPTIYMLVLVFIPFADILQKAPQTSWISKPYTLFVIIIYRCRKRLSQLLHTHVVLIAVCVLSALDAGCVLGQIICDILIMSG